jgi:hypothetical protein
MYAKPKLAFVLLSLFSNLICWATNTTAAPLLNIESPQSSASHSVQHPANNPPLTTASTATTIAPVFGQLLRFSMPKNFAVAFENGKDNRYIREAVPKGESVDKWSQMITVTGAKGLAANAKVTPQLFASKMAEGYKTTCPSSFNGTNLGVNKVGNYDAFAGVLSCGSVGQSDQSFSESMLLLVIKGEKDYYTIQWAERAAASASPIKFDAEKWTRRSQILAPIKLCDIVPGEAAPYLSCLNSK